MPAPQKSPFGFGASSPSLPVDPLADDQATPLWLRVSSPSQGAPPSQAPPPAANPQPAAPPRAGGLLQLPATPDPAPMRLALMQSTLGSAAGPKQQQPLPSEFSGGTQGETPSWQQLAPPGGWGKVGSEFLDSFPSPVPRQQPQQQAKPQPAQPQQAPQQRGQQELSAQSKKAIQDSILSSEQADALESAVKVAGQKYGIDPNDLIGIAFAESQMGSLMKNPTSTSSGLFGLTDGIKGSYGLSPSDAIGLSPDAITKQAYATAADLHKLMQRQRASSDTEHQFQIALAYYRGKHKPIDRALDGDGGYQDVLKLRFNKELFGDYLKEVKTLQKTPKPEKVKTPR